MDIVGTKVGRWTVIEDTGRRTTYRDHIYRCKCDCGTIRDVSARSLVRGKSKSCGCWRGERTARDNKSQKIREQRAKDSSARWPETRVSFGLMDNTSLSKIKSTKPREDNHTGVRGVSEIRPGVFVATLQFRKVPHRSKPYHTIEEAKKARDRMYEEYVLPYLEQIETENNHET